MNRIPNAQAGTGMKYRKIVYVGFLSIQKLMIEATPAEAPMI